MKDVPGQDAPPPETADMIIHAALVIGDDVLMASDDPTTDSFGPVQGIMVSYDAADVDDAKRVFEALAERRHRDPGARTDVLLGCLRHVRRPVRHAVDDRGARPEPGVLGAASSDRQRRHPRGRP